MLYLTLLTPILALPGLLFMDRVERWAAGDHPQAFRVLTQRPHGRRGRWPNGSTSSTRSSSADTTQPTPYRPATRHAPTESGVAVMNPSPNDYSATPRWHVHFVML